MDSKPEIHLDDLQGPEIANLLKEHRRDALQHSPPESVHTLDINGLRSPDITFWSVWQGESLMGCGALRELDPSHGEVKSMRTASAHRRQGVAALMLSHILQEAKRRGYKRVSLETGSMDAFAPARSLYARFGFKYCGPYGEYGEDPYSSFMTLEL
ncbi:MAG: GNAT family N-acetyltransferase [Cyanobacteria bacterium P01_A01_bin.135]